MDFIEVEGLRIAYERAGVGPPVVFIHGYVGDSRTWRAQVEDLSADFSVIVWDLPGFGRSSDPPDSFRLEDYARCLRGLLSALDVPRAHLAGLSFGAGLAIEFYRCYPEIPLSLVLASGYAGWPGSLEADEVEFRLTQALELAALGPAELVEALMPTMFSPSAPANLVKEFAASVAEFHPAGLRSSASAFAEADLRPVLPQIGVPTLLVYGQADVRAPASVARAIEGAIPHSKLIFIPDAGHIVNIESPALFNAEVRAFLRSVD